MARYDEDIYDNPFFIALEKENQLLFEKATANRWVICVPKFAAVKNEKLTKQDFEDHVLTPDVEIDGAFVTVSKQVPSVASALIVRSFTLQKVEINHGQINLGSRFKATKVDILFEETFYNAKDESYRIVCVSAFFNREESAESSDNSGFDSDLSRPPATYEECIKILWGNQGSSKTRDSLDKALKIFCGEYQRFEGTGDNISDLADIVSSQVTKAMQIVLKDKNLKKQVHENDLYLASLRIAVETYMMNAVHKHLFSTITASVKSADALVNKMTRNLGDIRLHHLEIRREFEENLPMARKELARLNKYSTPLGRTFCLKRVVTALTKPLFKTQENEDLVMTSDDLLPLLIYLIIKSQIPNWMANLTYMKYFQMVKVSETEEFSFYLATTEAALDYIKSGNVKEVKPTSKDTAYSRQASGSLTTSKEKFFQYVQFGDEAAVSLMLKKKSPTTDDVSSKLCHPLCTCEKCSEITVKNTQNSGAISAIARDDNLGRTALHIAAFHGQASLIDILAKHGCLIDATDYLGCTPLHLACQKGYQNIILLLVHFGADIGTVENEGNTPLHLCAKNGHEDCVKAILFLDILKNKLNVNAGNDMGDTPLHLAAKWGYDGIVNFLLESEADPRIRNRKRQTPFNVAQNPDIKKELLRIMKDPPPMIVNHPVIPNYLPVTSVPNTPCNPSSPSPSQLTPDSSTKTTHDKSPLGFQIVDVIPVRSSIQLLDNSSSQMMSPTIPAVASLDNGNAKQIERLFKAIANKDLPLVKYYFGWVDSSSSEEDSSAPTSPVRSGDIVASLCHPLCQCEKCQHIQKHSSINWIDVNCRNHQGWSPLHKAVTENNMEVLDLLLKKGAFVNVQTRKRVSALHLACYHNHLEIVEKLVSCGANVNLQDQHGEIPLHLASAKACPDIVRFLLEQSSTVNLCNIEGYTPLHHAVCIGSIEVVKLLLEHGATPDIVTKQQSSPITMARNPVILNMLKMKLKEHPAVLHSKDQSVSLNIPGESHTGSDTTLPSAGVSHTVSDTTLPSVGESHTVSDTAPPSDPDGSKVLSTSSPVSDSTADSPTPSHESDVLQKIVSSWDTENVDKLKQIGQDIQSFDKQRRLRRSQTFDHTYTTLNSANLKLSLSIQHFDKQKNLKRTPTFDKSSTLLRSLEHSSSIQHFDTRSLKHVDLIDKSSPMHIYSLVRSYSGYLDTPDDDVDTAEEILTEVNPVDKSAETEEDKESAISKEPELDNGSDEIAEGTKHFKLEKDIISDVVPDVKETASDVSVNTDTGNHDSSIVGSFSDISQKASAIKANHVESVPDDKTDTDCIVVENNCDTSVDDKPNLNNLEEFHDELVQSVTEITVNDNVQCAISNEQVIGDEIKM